MNFNINEIDIIGIIIPKVYSKVIFDNFKDSYGGYICGHTAIQLYSKDAYSDYKKIMEYLLINSISFTIKYYDLSRSRVIFTSENEYYCERNTEIISTYEINKIKEMEIMNAI